MATTTTTLTDCYELFGFIFPTSTLEWGDVTTYTTDWAGWTTWGAENTLSGGSPVATYNDAVIQIDDDLDTSVSRRPKCTFNTLVASTVVLKISDTGSFGGEETTINFVANTPVSFVKGRYYRWTITIANNPGVYTPFYVTSVGTSYDTRYTQEFFNDLSLAGLTQDSEGHREVPLSSIGLVLNVQGTALQGFDYVVEGYIVTPTDQATYYRSYVLTPVNSGTTISTATKKFGTGSFEFDGSAKVTTTDTRIYDYSTDSTLEFWLNLTSDTSGQAVFSIADSGNTAVQYGFTSHQNATQYTFSHQVQGETSGSEVNNTSNLDYGTWYHIAVVSNGTDWTIYVNGTDDTNATQSNIVGGVKQGAEILRLGAGANGTADMVGFIDDFHMRSGRQYTGNFTAPIEAWTNQPTTTILLNADDYTDNRGINYGTDKYIEDQIGGAVVIENKNPLTVKVVDYNGNTWDGTVDLLVHGLDKITKNTQGVS